MKRAQRPVGPGPGDPEVLLDVVCERGCLYLVLANDGGATAFDVGVEFKRPLLGAGGEEEVTAAGVFRRLPLLRAGREIRVFVDTVPAFFGRRQARTLNATVSYRDRARRQFREVFRHDLRIWRDFGEVVD